LQQTPELTFHIRRWRAVRKDVEHELAREEEAEAPELIGGYRGHGKRRFRSGGNERLEAHVAPVRAWHIPLEVLQIGQWIRRCEQIAGCNNQPLRSNQSPGTRDVQCVLARFAAPELNVSPHPPVAQVEP